MLTIIIFIAIFAVLVLSHEWGHFIAARFSKMRVDEFGIGFSPRIFGWRAKSGTMYSLNWIPLGGFVKIKGEDGESSSDPDSFGSKKVWQKSLVLFAGVGMNVVLAAVLLSIGYIIGLPQTVDGLTDVSAVRDRRIEILQVLPDKPAAVAGIQSGDVILRVGELENPRLVALQDYVNAHRDETLLVKVKRNDEIITKMIKPAIYADTGRGGLGVAIAEVGEVRYPWYSAIFHGITATGWYLKEIVTALTHLFASLFSGGGVGETVTGPIGIAVMTSKVARLGLVYLIQFTAMLSLNLAIINILPIPALDGGRLLFLLWGKLTRRPIKAHYEQWAHTVGFWLLILLLVVVTIKDLSIFRGTFVNLWQRIF